MSLPTPRNGWNTGDGGSTNGLVTLFSPARAGTIEAARAIRVAENNFRNGDCQGVVPGMASLLTGLRVELCIISVRRTIPEQDITAHEPVNIDWLSDDAAMCDVTACWTNPATALRAGCDTDAGVAPRKRNAPKREQITRCSARGRRTCVPAELSRVQGGLLSARLPRR